MLTEHLLVSELDNDGYYQHSRKTNPNKLNIYKLPQEDGHSSPYYKYNPEFRIFTSHKQNQMSVS